MSRVGWVILALVATVAALFASVTRFGGSHRSAPSATPPVAGTAHDAEPLAVPVAGVARGRISDSWGDPRGEGGRTHQGTDIMAPGGTAVLAAASGRVEKLFTSERGGLTIYVRSPGGGWVYYYAHLAGYAPGLAEGQRVARGQRIGFVGDTGDAGAGNTHLHFGLQRMAPGEGWWQGRAVNPYPLLAGSTAGR
ncbi:M23 family metallopeptidase [Sphingomonas abaci]|uniref:Murein DD-endopeptidase MepM/ murein hydrolase activator NlpD n=1 Tax=Sphingomonas abaci TaxID=237611 RepID=A0A7W7EZV7_9SPHN|nr:M23 family metallopeptidase [Sphingomonas abaci]MBB4617750.1 murein DD-endopeptidase MepM/ murein hydrolase activator NlpD [Sphingomonas abaci]